MKTIIQVFAYFDDHSRPFKRKILVLFLFCGLRLKLVSEGGYGTKKEDGTWNGMLGEIINGVSSLFCLSPETFCRFRRVQNMNIIAFALPKSRFATENKSLVSYS